MGIRTLFVGCLLLICSHKAFGEECSKVFGEDANPGVARAQGTPGKVGPAGVVDYDEIKKIVANMSTSGPKGDAGTKGDKGDRGAPGSPGPKADSEGKQVLKRLEVVTTQFSDLTGRLEKLEKEVGKLNKRLKRKEEEEAVGAGAANEDESGCSKVKYGQKCFWSVTFPSTKTGFGKAEEVCKENGGELANIYSEEHFQLMVEEIRKNMPPGRSYVSIWTGMKIDVATGDVTLTDGKEAPFLQWYTSFPSIGKDFANFKHIALIVRRSSRLSGQGMGNYYPSSPFYGVICQM